MPTHHQPEKHSPFGLNPPVVPLWPVSKKYPTWPGLPANPTPAQMRAWEAKHQDYIGEPSRQLVGGSWWNPSRWWDDFSGFVVGSFDDVKKWTLTAGRDIGNLLHEEVHTVWSLGSGWMHDAERWIEDGFRDIEKGLHDAGEFVIHMFHRVWHDAAHWFDVARHEAAHLFDMARHLAAHYADDIRKWAVEVFRKDIWGRLDALWHWYLHALDWVWRLIVKGAKDVFRDLIRPIERFVMDLIHRVGRLESIVFGDILMWIRVLEKAADWLLWFAEHAAEDFLHVAEEGEHDLTTWLRQPSSND